MWISSDEVRFIEERQAKATVDPQWRSGKEIRTSLCKNVLHFVRATPPWRSVSLSFNVSEESFRVT
jgi:hypothetical protein